MIDLNIATSDDGQKTFCRMIVVMPLISLVIAVSQVVIRGRDFLEGDSLYWHLAAKYFSEGMGFIHPIIYFSTGIESQAADHPPIFIIYLSIISKLGFDSVLGHQIATAILPVVIVPMFGLLARRIGGFRVGTVAMTLAALHPLMWGWSPLVMSEPLAVLMVLILLLVAFNYKRFQDIIEVKTSINLLLGAAIGLATLTRSELLLTGTLIAIFVSFSRNFYTWGKRLFLIGLSCLVILSPWVGYNLNRFEKPVLLSIGSDITFASAYCDETFYGEFTGYWSFQCQELAWEYARAMATTDDPDQSELMPFVKTYWRDYLSNNKRRAVTVVPLRVGRALGVYKPRQQMRLERYVDDKSPEVIYSSWAFFYLLAPLSLIGFRRGRLTSISKIIFLTPILTSILTVSITWGNPRYRFSIDVIMVILGSIGICHLITRSRSKLMSGDRDQESISPEGPN